MRSATLAADAVLSVVQVDEQAIARDEINRMVGGIDVFAGPATHSETPPLNENVGAFDVKAARGASRPKAGEKESK